jgi:retinol-binding protein 3
MNTIILKIAMIVTVFTFSALAQQNLNDQQDTVIDAAVRGQVIEGVLKKLNDTYIFPDVAKKMESDVRHRIQNKEYDALASSKEFSRKLTEDLQSVSHDKHLRIRYSFEKIPVRPDDSEPTAEEKDKYDRFMKRTNYGFEKVERMEGNIGYIDFRGFTDPIGGAETVAAAMNFINSTDALIFDLRQNGGGDPAMVALICSYLFGEKPVHLNDLYYREGNKTEEYWTKTSVLGKKYGDKDVYVLTSNRTFSGAEEFTNNLKVLRRATVIGETTGGGANPGSVVRISDHFGVFIPVGRAVNPTTKTNWEGTGVEPDVKVPKEIALKTAYLMALNKSMEKSKDDGMKAGLKHLIDRTQKELDELKAKK